MGGLGAGGEMIYIGIDLSLTGTGIVVLDEQGNVLDKDLISTKASHKIEDRLKTIWNRLKYIIWDFADKPVPGCHIAIEGLSFGSRGTSMLELAGLHYLIRYMIDREFCGVRHVVPPQTLKKFVCGKGNVKKEQMLLQTYKKWGMEFQDNNICDAYCLARYAMENSQ
jgi:Holliday junction resolvasome RuvABC endonuclease subunit